MWIKSLIKKDFEKNTAARVAKNSIAVLIAQISNIALNILILGFIARYLGLSGYGSYYSIYAFILIFEIASDMGLRSIMVREIAKDKTNTAEHMGNAIILKALMSSLTMVFVYVFAHFYIEADLQIAFYIAGFASVTQVSTDFFSWLFRGFEKMEYDTTFGILNRVVLFIFVLIGIYLKYGITFFFIAILISNIIRIIAESFISFKKFVIPKFKIDFNAWKLLLIQSVPLGISVLLMILARRVNIFLLDYLRNDDEVGLFSSAFTIITGLAFVPTTFTSATFPVFSRFADSARESLNKSFEMSFKLLLILSIPFTISLFILGKDVLVLIFGGAFVGAIAVIQIMSISLPFRFLNFLFRFVLTSINKQNVELLSVTISLVVSIVLSYLCISWWGSWGAGLTITLAEIITFIIKYYVISKFLSYVSIFKIVVKPMICALIMCIVLFLFKTINPFLLLFLGTSSYSIGVLLLKSFSPEELKVFRRAIHWQSLQQRE